MTRLDRSDDDAYRAVVAPLVPWIERSLGAEVIANRARWGSDGWGLRAWAPARAAWNSRVSSAVDEAQPGTTFAVADVRACYPGIAPATLRELLGPTAAPIAGLLERFADAGVRGLPIGPDPSAVLANAVLARIDEALRRSAVRHVRWVDDVVLWGEREDVVRALAAAHRAAEDVGLDLHATKTRILDGADELHERVGGPGPSGISRVRAGGGSPPIIAAP